MKTLLITGGAGFIGANFVYYELETRPDMEIICLDKLTYAGNLLSLREAMKNPRFHFICADIGDAEAVERVFAEFNPDTVVNFAAETHVDRSIIMPGLFLGTNILGVQVLMDASLKYGVRRFHQISTDEVYGDLPLEAVSLRFTEQSTLRPSSPYAASKASADLLVMAYARTYGLPVSISRCSNNYGRFQFPEKLIPLMLRNALRGEKLPVYGTGKNVRDWLHVRDHCRAVDLIITRGRTGCLYNLGGDCELANIDLVRRICDLTGASQELISYVPDRKGHDLRYAMDHALITSELGWKPEIPFDVGLSETINWYIENADWCESIITGEYYDYCRRFRGELPGE